MGDLVHYFVGIDISHEANDGVFVRVTVDFAVRVQKTLKYTRRAARLNCFPRIVQNFNEYFNFPYITTNKLYHIVGLACAANNVDNKCLLNKCHKMCTELTMITSI